jgi:hypothetical protein
MKHRATPLEMGQRAISSLATLRILTVGRPCHAPIINGRSLCNPSFRPTSHESLSRRSLIRQIPLEGSDTNEDPTSENYRFSD